MTVIGMEIEIIIETIPVIERMVREETRTIGPIPAHVIEMIDITMTEREHIEMITTAMIGLTDAGPGTNTMIMTREIVNVEGSMMIENDLGLLTIGIIGRNQLMMNLPILQGNFCLKWLYTYC
jgi:hypothetical protein